MLFSIAVLLFAGLIAGRLCERLRLPGLFGMILAGILIGPYALNLLSAELLELSATLRKIALIIILIRAGLKLHVSDLKKVGRPAVLMCFLPACFELLGMILLAPRLLGLSVLESAVLGAVVGAVSPAVVVPKMIRMIDEGCGTAQGVPQMILAGASVDDVFVIVLFTTFTGLARGEGVSALRLVGIPVSVATGAAAGLAVGYLLLRLFARGAVRQTVMATVLFGAAFLFTAAEDRFADLVPFASLIAVMGVGVEINRRNPALAADLSARFDRLWTPAEIFLFVLVGASVAIDSALSAGPTAVLLVLGALLFRMAGVFVCLIGTSLNRKERLFCMLAYTPKATVQAAIGGLPLAMGLACGETVLTVSVVAILLTAPLGAFVIDRTYRRLCARSS